MTAFLVKQKCYYGEGQNKPRLMYAGDVYVSHTLDPKKAPSFLEVKKAAPLVVSNKPAANTEGELSYQEMKTFIADNKIEVADYKKPTMEKAIAAFKAGGAPAANTEESDEAEEEAETEKEAEEE